MLIRQVQRVFAASTACRSANVQYCTNCEIHALAAKHFLTRQRVRYCHPWSCRRCASARSAGKAFVRALPHQAMNRPTAAIYTALPAALAGHPEGHGTIWHNMGDTSSQYPSKWFWLHHQHQDLGHQPGSATPRTAQLQVLDMHAVQQTRQYSATGAHRKYSILTSQSQRQVTVHNSQPKRIVEVLQTRN